MTRPLFSVVCVYNDEKVKNDWLMGGLTTQDCGFEQILVDNTARKFGSAAEGLNYGGTKAGGEYIIFMHQDVRLPSPDWLRRAEIFLRQIPDAGVAGVAGMLPSPRLGIWQIATIPEENRIGLVLSGGEKPELFCGKPMAAPVVVQTLDEQVLVIPAKVFSRLPFDEATCDNWHLYGVDYALSVRALGLKAYVLPLSAHHKSMGFTDALYFRTLKKIFRKHRGYKAIFTTCGSWYTNILYNCAALVLMAGRLQAGKWVGRNNEGGKQSLDLLGLLLRS